ncbi:protein ANTI-SILENCING 1 isoform X2 [Ricinus communis]|uniref:protein ANTI-SILENCING 1 isoform X2 n=1 Tax=Ricinus communis TaxID=3988 RepID=UPI00201AF13A|nr:protein ANTI-SILENCING 1 isoform X2 [Ricinus communis]XP_048234127.1 protein ANTI-SILENCING 1 isoform X2 [Ricinus communis]
MFKWGIKKADSRTNKDFKFYQSFTYCGVEYYLYDCVYFHGKDSVNSYIGKLVRIYETPAKEKKVKVVWFFHPSEISKFLGDYEPKWNEVFLASGQGEGLSNINHLEAIVGKCNVVCVSNDNRNPQATEVELKMADFIFYRCFDVGERRIVEDFANHIDGIRVESFFNKRKDQQVNAPPALELNVKKGGHAVRDVKSGSSSSPVVKESMVTASLRLKERILNENITRRPRTPIDNDRIGPNKVPCNQIDKNAESVSYSRDSSAPNTNAAWPVKKRKLLHDEMASKVVTVDPCIASDGGLKTIPRITAKPHAEGGKWFKQVPWREKLRRSEEAGTLVLLENLDPSLASSDVEDLIWHALKLRVEAKMIQRSTLSSLLYGKAFVVFGSKEAAESAIFKLQTRCLVLTDGRPIVGSRGSLKDPAKSADFTGHICLSKIRKKQTQEMRKAVSTSHLSQPNTIEYEMAIERRLLQKQFDECWNELHRHAQEIEDLKSPRR